MTRISEEAKQALIRKVLCNNGQSIAEIAQANNIGCSTLNKWVRTFKIENNIIENPATITTTLTLAERFKHLKETYGQDSATIGAYCRKHGLYPHQLTQWEVDFMTTPAQSKPSKNNPELKKLRLENKQLKQLLTRKDKVLAETVALLVLKKKAAQIWGETEED